MDGGLTWRHVVTVNDQRQDRTVYILDDGE